MYFFLWKQYRDNSFSDISTHPHPQLTPHMKGVEGHMF